MSVDVFEPLRQALETFFQGAWNTSNAAVMWDGIPEDPPADGSPFLTCSIETGKTTRLTLGPQYDKRIVGFVQHIVSTAPNGSSVANQLADDLAALWEPQNINVGSNAYIRFHEVSKQRLGIRDSRFLVAVTAPFWYDVLVR